ncbi:SulP family inorganic anion transporter [Paracoccus aestuarii]|uniref:SulP family inorganic anion transporter n=1 Tax=Paracoccus aestuarii TaxID=453842 RepID=A0A418ZW54_9RHOB|nr:SulP family inorganic anion transporter [Paracoccus aestuarii]RJL04726.1 SulP family inorganic anion transporter [Paracoccus aestuarii]WCQ97956.1 SulP family inorganic anion transporter [Paracoccus aestuarii]
MGYRPAFLDLSISAKDVQAGLTVAIVALPLSLAIAIASGVGPDRGLVTAIVGGFLVSALGGTRHQIGGPAGAFIVLVAACVAAIGIEGLIMATALSGVMLALLGAFRLGGAIRFVPYPVILGFTAGIAVIIAASQLRDLLGLTLTGSEPGALIPKLLALWAARASLSPATAAVAALTVAVILACTRMAPRLPAMLMGIIAAMLAAQVLPVVTVADRFGALPTGLPMPQLPRMDAALLMAALPFALGFTLLGAIESLLSAMVADQMAGSRMRPDDELIGQGAANLGAALFGGFCTTGTIARTATNVKAGSRGPASGMIHAGLLLVFLLVAAPVVGAIPLAGLAGLLMVVSWKMIEWHAITALTRIDRAEAGVMGLTFATVVLVDLITGILVGTGLAGLIFVARMARAGRAEAPARPAGEAGGRMVVHLSGPVFFGSVARIGGVLDRIDARPRLLVLDMAQVTLLDPSGAQMIADLAARLRAQGAGLAVAGLSADLDHGLPASIPRL